MEDKRSFNVINFNWLRNVNNDLTLPPPTSCIQWYVSIVVSYLEPWHFFLFWAPVSTCTIKPFLPFSPSWHHQHAINLKALALSELRGKWTLKWTVCQDKQHQTLHGLTCRPTDPSSPLLVSGVEWLMEQNSRNTNWTRGHNIPAPIHLCSKQGWGDT